MALTPVEFDEQDTVREKIAGVTNTSNTYLTELPSVWTYVILSCSGYTSIYTALKSADTGNVLKRETIYEGTHANAPRLTASGNNAIVRLNSGTTASNVYALMFKMQS